MGNMIIEAPTDQAGCGVDMSQLIEAGDVLNYFPLHHPMVGKQLEKEWCRHQFPSSQPFDLFREYFGAKVGLFYVYLCHHTTWTGYLAIVGLGVGIQALLQWEVDTLANEIFALFVAVWAVCLNEFWKQKEARIALRWGMTDFESVESERPAFLQSTADGMAMIASPINGAQIKYYPESKRACSQQIAMVVTFFMMLLVAAFIGVVFHLKNTLGGYWPDYL